MKKLGLLLTLLISPCLARAVKPASLAEQASIQALIDQANEVNKTSSSNPSVRDVDRLKKDLAREGLKPESQQNRGRIAALQVELKALKTQRDKLYQQAARMTLLAYGLVDLDAKGLPIMPTKTAVHPSVNGRMAHWIVVYKEDEPRVLLDNAGKAETIPAGNKSVGGFTGADGVTTMYGNFRSPADLALLLYHERVHYEQFTTKGVGDKLTYDEREEKAYQAQYRRLGEFGLTPAELKTFEVFLAGDPNDPSKPGKIREHHDKAKIERRKLTVSLGLWGGGEPASIQPRERGEYDALLEESKEFDSQLANASRVMIAHAREEAARQKEAADNRELQEEFQRRIDALPPPIELHPTQRGGLPLGVVPAVPTRPQNVAPIVAGRPPISGLQFKYIASRACSAPPQAVDLELASMDWALFQKEKIDERIADGLSACERRVVLRLIALGRTWRPGVVIGANEVLAAAAEPSSGGGGWVPPTQDHDPVWGKIGPIIGR